MAFPVLCPWPGTSSTDWLPSFATVAATEVQESMLAKHAARAHSSAKALLLLLQLGRFLTPEQ